jgi:hypothetical protein
MPILYKFHQVVFCCHLVAANLFLATRWWPLFARNPESVYICTGERPQTHGAKWQIYMVDAPRPTGTGGFRFFYKKNCQNFVFVCFSLPKKSDIFKNEFVRDIKRWFGSGTMAKWILWKNKIIKICILLFQNIVFKILFFKISSFCLMLYVDLRD